MALERDEGDELKRLGVVLKHFELAVDVSDFIFFELLDLLQRAVLDLELRDEDLHSGPVIENTSVVLLGHVHSLYLLVGFAHEEVAAGVELEYEDVEQEGPVVRNELYLVSYVVADQSYFVVLAELFVLWVGHAHS